MMRIPPFFSGLLICAAVLLPHTLQAREWVFSVWLDKQSIGTHSFTLQNNRLSSRASFNVKVLFINAYRYLHQADEVWQADCLQSLHAHTEENSVITEVDGRLLDGQFVVSKRDTTLTLPACVMTFAYWNPNILQQSRLLNPQNAEYLDITVNDEGMQALAVKGTEIATHQYRLTGRYQGKTKLNITLWYDEQQRWVGLKSITPEGYTITYKLI